MDFNVHDQLPDHFHHRQVLMILRYTAMDRFFNDSQEAAYGVVVSNNHDQVCDGKAEIMHCFPPLEAEAKALLEGSRLSSDHPAWSVLTVCPLFMQSTTTRDHGHGERQHGLALSDKRWNLIQ
ncbi:unnamed protein product [Linum trigynum]|uniref:RNase H type-1 domain-containing protein n=1 Tax=Linum trigynum TaxID=586398 RepID=A0AAV2DR35_9ROSI